MKIYETITKDIWTKGTIARDKDGKPVGHLSTDAYSRCLVGWIRKCYPPIEQPSVLVRVNDNV